MLWERNIPSPQESEFYYYFNEFSMNLNNLTQETLKNICETDCRLRPDQRALEYGLIDLAISEKHRLEEK